MFAVALAGAAVQAAGQVRAANAMSASAIQQANLMNASAADALQRGGIEASKQRDAASRFASEQRAAFASSGVDLASGSAVGVVASTEGMGAYEALVIRNNAARAAWGLSSNAAITRWEGSEAKKNAKIAAAGTFLSSAASAVGSYK
jgi:hypothetical protein